MAKNLSLRQYVYKYPDDNSDSNFILGKELFESAIMEDIQSIGIQAPRGTKFIINGAEGRIGPTGIFELDMVIPIYSLKIGEADSANNKILVDILYTKKGE